MNGADLRDPTLWKDDANATPPVQWEFLAADERWWWTNAAAGLIHFLGDDSVLSSDDVVCYWEVTEPSDSPANMFPLSVIVGDMPAQDIPNEVGSGSFAVPRGTEINSITVQSALDASPYGAVVALNFTGGGCPYNCDCTEENDNLTLAEYRSKLLVRAGFAAVASNPPPGTAALFNAFLQDAQDVLYRKYPALETRRFFHWPLQVGQRFYGLRDDTKEGCPVNLEPYKNIEGAWLIDLNGQWLPVAEGIPPEFYTTVNQPGLPFRYEIRQCIEIFPGPPADGYTLIIKGHFGKRAFTAEDDKPTMNGELVYLFALANALDYYGKPSARTIMGQAEDLLGQLVAGTHGSRRYVPGTRPIGPAVMPALAPGWPNI